MKIAFYKSTRQGWQGWFNRLVRWWTHGPYSHCEAVLEENDGWALCGSSSFIDGGVRLKWMQLDSAHWDLVDVPADANAVAAWFDAHEGCKYDVLGIVRQVMRRGDGSKSKFVCGESVQAARGVTCPWRFDPNTLYAMALHESKQRTTL